MWSLEKRRKYQKEWVKENPEKRRKYQKEWVKRNPNYIQEWKLRNPNKVKKYQKLSIEWTKKSRKNIKDRYGLGAGTVARYGFKLALEIYDRFNRECAFCGDKYDLTIHHLDGIGRNYENMGFKANNNKNNLILICRRCHGSIHGKEGRGIKKTRR